MMEGKKRKLLDTSKVMEANLKAKYKKKSHMKKPSLSKEDAKSATQSLMSRKRQPSPTVKNIMRHSFQIQRYLNFTELLPALVHPDLQFLSTKEIDHIHRLPTDTQRANTLLLVLRKRSSLEAGKFLASLWLTREHLGHEELFSSIFPQVPEGEVEDVIQLCKLSSLSSPEKPPAFVEPQGDLTDTKFLKVQTYLWELFGRGEYSSIAKITGQLRGSPSPDWAIVGMWFESMNCVFIHECKDHQKCVADLLEPALERCRHPSVTNRNILEGRIYLRMSQVFLTRGEKTTASEYSEHAKELLLFTRGYDRAKLFLREPRSSRHSLPTPGRRWRRSTSLPWTTLMSTTPAVDPQLTFLWLPSISTFPSVPSWCWSLPPLLSARRTSARPRLSWRQCRVCFCPP